MDPFTIAYLVLGVLTLAVELVAVRDRRKGNTISEHWWAIQRRHPVAARVAFGVFWLWVGIHFLTGGLL